MSEYDQIIDGIGVSVRSNRRFRLACCDCGLVHEVVIAGPNKGGWLGLAMRRSKKATRQYRKADAKLVAIMKIKYQLLKGLAW